MFYDFAVTVPANTAEDTPVETLLELTNGIIHRIEVQFPIGTRALVHCKLLHRRTQQWPTNADGDFASDGHVIVIDEHYDLTEPPHELTVLAWSTADTYSYDINIRIGVLPREVISPFTGVVGALRKLVKFMGVGG